MSYNLLRDILPRSTSREPAKRLHASIPRYVIPKNNMKMYLRPTHGYVAECRTHTKERFKL